MPDHTDPTSSPDSTPASHPQRKATRRRLLQGGLAAAPVLMTLVSRPVLAQQCTTPSGFISLNASTAGRGVACTGRTPGFWKTQRAWPTAYKTTTTFNSVFTSPKHYSDTTTLLDVLTPQIVGGGPPNDVARHIVAALLNVASGWAPVLTLTTLKDIWSEYLSKGSYSPSSGVNWTHDQIVAYLLTTMPL